MELEHEDRVSLWRWCDHPCRRGRRSARYLWATAPVLSVRCRTEAADLDLSLVSGGGTRAQGSAGVWTNVYSAIGCSPASSTANRRIVAVCAGDLRLAAAESTSPAAGSNGMSGSRLSPCSYTCTKSTRVAFSRVACNRLTTASSAALIVQLTLPPGATWYSRTLSPSCFISCTKSGEITARTSPLRNAELIPAPSLTRSPSRSLHRAQPRRCSSIRSSSFCGSSPNPVIDERSKRNRRDATRDAFTVGCRPCSCIRAASAGRGGG